MSFHTTTNKTFPAHFEDDCPHGSSPEEFIGNLNASANNISEGEIRLPPGILTKGDRATLAVDNPVAFVLENKAILNHILCILIGLKPDSQAFYSKSDAVSSRRTRYFKASKGVFGHPLYAIGVTEDHCRGTLHWHISLLSGLPPYVLQRFANMGSLCDAISETLDAAYKSEMPEEVHIGTILREAISQQRNAWSIPDAVITSILDPEQLLQQSDPCKSIQNKNGTISIAKLEHLTVRRAGRIQHHFHRKLCHTGKNGITGCRLNQPTATIAATRPVKLIPLPPIPEDVIPLTASVSPSLLPTSQDTASPANGHVPVRPKKSKFRTKAGENFVVVPMPFTEGTVDDEAPEVYHLKPILTGELQTSVVYWETKRPDITPTLLPPIPERDDGDPFDDANNNTGDAEPTRQTLYSTFRTALQAIPGYKDESSAFWRWLKDEAIDDYVLQLWQHVQFHLPSANGLVPTFNTTLSYCTGSHHNTSLLGSLGQAKSALYYLIPYEGKNKFPLEQCLVILDKTLMDIKKYPSKAVDSGSMERTTKHLLTRALNRMHLEMEISDYQIAAALLDLPSVITTDRFAYGNPNALTAFQTQMQMKDDDIQAYQKICDQLASRKANRNRFRTSGMDDLHERMQQDLLNDDSEDEYDVETLANKKASVIDENPYNTADVLKDLGHIRKLKLRGGTVAAKPEEPATPDRHILIPEASLYFFRSPVLRQLSYYECLACTEVQNKPPIEDRVDSCKSLHSQRHFELTVAFEGCFDCVQVLLQKQRTPLLCGGYPRHPGTTPLVAENTPAFRSWQKDADAFARYYLILFRPDWPDSGLLYTWSTLQAWIDQLQRDTTILSKFRLMVLDQHIKGFRTSAASKNMTKAYRARSRKMWSASEQSKYASQAAYDKALAERNSPPTLFDRFNDEELQPLSKLTKANMSKQLYHDQCQMLQMRKLALPDVPNPQRRGRRMIAKFLAPYLQLSKLHQVSSNMKSWKDPDIAAAQKGRTHAPFVTGQGQRANVIPSIAKIRSRLSKRGEAANSQQLEFFDLYSNYYRDLLDPPPHQLHRPPTVTLLHGGPGMGKSMLREAVSDCAELCNQVVFKSAYNNINAVEMGARTTTMWMGSRNTGDSILGSFKPESIRELRNMGFGRNSLVIVEEVSNQTPWHLARLNAFCQEITNNYDDLFGGALVILAGDLTQLGPVKAGATITQALMDIKLDVQYWSQQKAKQRREALRVESNLPRDGVNKDKYKNNHPYTMGANILTQARWFELTQQNRSTDPSHTSFVKHTYHGGEITFGKMRELGYKILSREDSTKNDWIRASVLVATNRERHTLTYERAIQFAKANGTVVIRWQCHRDKWMQEPIVPEHWEEAIGDPCFYEYFVVGADGFLTENIQRDLRLVNAVAVQYDSIKFEQDDQAYLQARLDTAQPGDVIDMKNRPVSVNVVVQLDPKTTPKHVLTALKEFSLRKSKRNAKSVILPIYACTCRPDTAMTTIRGGTNFPPSKVLLRRSFPLETAFAITVHKSEGRTLRRVIIALSKNYAQGCAFSYTQVHVALSRVQCRDNIRLFLTGSTEDEQWLSLRYLRNLRPDTSTKFFFGGFRASGKGNPNVNWETDNWSRERANHTYGETVRQPQN